MRRPLPSRPGGARVISRAGAWLDVGPRGPHTEQTSGRAVPLTEELRRGATPGCRQPWRRTVQAEMWTTSWSLCLRTASASRSSRTTPTGFRYSSTAISSRRCFWDVLTGAAWSSSPRGIPARRCSITTPPYASEDDERPKRGGPPALGGRSRSARSGGCSPALAVGDSRLESLTRRGGCCRQDLVP